MSEPDELFWCHGCYAFRPWTHKLRRPPVRIRLRRAVGRVLQKAATRLVGIEFEPELPPPAGYELVGCTRALRIGSEIWKKEGRP